MRRQGGTEDPRQAAEAEAEKNEKRRLMLKGILTPEAFERLHRIELVRPDKSQRLGNYLIANGRQLAGGAAISEDQLIHLLEQFADSKAKIEFKRKHDGSDDDWDT